jgi:ssDNA-binding Zn-finger/Zn-ribbon topoisomerase 1
MPLWDEVDEEDEPEGKLPDRTRVKKRCPDCGAEMIVRTNRENGSQFLGCTSYPKCKRTEEIPENIRMELEGQPKLFKEET